MSPNETTGRAGPSSDGNPKGARRLSRTRLLLFLTPLLLALGVLAFYAWRLHRSHARFLETVRAAAANPDSLKPKEFLARIDSSFSSLPEAERRRIMDDPKLLSERIENAAYENYKRTFGELFLLPGPLRRQLINRSAASIAASIEKNPARVDAFYDSPGGRAALRAASKYFLFELKGSEKAELKPISDAFFKIHKDRAARGKD
jgi:hypothetical protein